MENFVLINLSNRHVHLSQADVETLFGTGHQLTKIKDLMQPGQFACAETVTIAGAKNSIENVRVLGPARTETQVEVLNSDLYKLGLSSAPLRESGQLAGSAPVRLIGPKGTVEKSQGLIIAVRHVHMDPESALRYGCKDKEIVKLRVGQPGREALLENVVIRVHASFALEGHIDFDEGNAVGIGNGTKGEIIR